MTWAALRYGWILLAVLGIVGVSGVLVLELAGAAAILSTTGCLLHSAGLLPGTEPYEQKWQVERQRAGLEMDRIQRTRTRLRAAENRDLALMLGPGKEDE